jgi:Tfp pilus assembly protein PilX
VIALRSQRGNAMAISIMIVFLMTTLALGTYSYVQGQQRQSADERVKDSAYNLAEAALESAVAYLGSGSVWTTMNGSTPWPWGAAQGQATAGNCSQSSLATDNCPDPSTVTSSFNASNQQDYAGAPTWVTTVRDNSQPSTACTPLALAGSCFYRESITNAAGVPEYDANGDGAVWVRAKATVQGRTRILVALVKPQPVPIPYPRQVYAGGYLTISNTLNQKVIDTQGSAASAGLVRLSCYFPTSPGPNNGGCPTADPTKGQIQPWTLQTGVLLNDCINNIGVVITGISCVSKDVKTDLANLKAKAQAAGTYYTACPSPRLAARCPWAPTTAQRVPG